MEDIEQLINFFVIEFQRVLFAEKVSHTIAVSLYPCTDDVILTIIGICRFSDLVLAHQIYSSMGSLSHLHLGHLPSPSGVRQ